MPYLRTGLLLISPSLARSAVTVVDENCAPLSVAMVFVTYLILFFLLRNDLNLVRYRIRPTIVPECKKLCPGR